MTDQRAAEATVVVSIDVDEPNYSAKEEPRRESYRHDRYELLDNVHKNVSKTLFNNTEVPTTYKHVYQTEHELDN